MEASTTVLPPRHLELEDCPGCGEPTLNVAAFGSMCDSCEESFAAARAKIAAEDAAEEIADDIAYWGSR